MKAILGRKLGMTQVFDDQGRVVPVTVIEAGPCTVVQKKSQATDGYDAIQLGFMDLPERKVNRPMKGHFDKAGVPPKRYLREVRGMTELQVGDEVKVDIFSPGELVDVTGTSKGKGFQGVIKRYHWHGGPQTHGSMVHRKPQSSGSTDPARVFKGTGKPGHMGNERVTVKRLQVVRVIPEKNLLLVKGAVPGARGGLLYIRGAS